MQAFTKSSNPQCDNDKLSTFSQYFLFTVAVRVRKGCLLNNTVLSCYTDNQPSDEESTEYEQTCSGVSVSRESLKVGPSSVP